MEIKMSTSRKIELTQQNINGLLNAYDNLTTILESIIDRKVLYKNEFIQKMDSALEEVEKKNTTPVNSFSDFIS